MQVEVALGGGEVAVGQIEVDAGVEPAEIAADRAMGDDDSSLRAAAVAWNALARNGVFTVNGHQYSATECAEWWA
jgi:hypothetical protein